MASASAGRKARPDFRRGQGSRLALPLPRLKHTLACLDGYSLGTWSVVGCPPHLILLCIQPVMLGRTFRHYGNARYS
jgi:hypothetical protein